MNFFRFNRGGKTHDNCAFIAAQLNKGRDVLIVGLKDPSDILIRLHKLGVDAKSEPVIKEARVRITYATDEFSPDGIKWDQEALVGYRFKIKQGGM